MRARIGLPSLPKVLPGLVPRTCSRGASCVRYSDGTMDVHNAPRADAGVSALISSGPGPDRRALSVLARSAEVARRHREQLLYLAFGGWNTVFGYGVWAMLQFGLGERLPYLAIVVLSWPIAVLNAYVVYRSFVFRSRGPIVRELPRFSLVYLATLVVNLAMLPVALRVLPFNIYVVQALFLAVVVVCSYLGHKYFSFGGKHARHVGDTTVHDGPAAGGE
jgi:putative flippase GtrA